MNTLEQRLNRHMSDQSIIYGTGPLKVREHFTCKNGVKVSIQQSELHWCDNATTYEVWWPLASGPKGHVTKEELLRRLAEIEGDLHGHS